MEYSGAVAGLGKTDSTDTLGQLIDLHGSTCQSSGEYDVDTFDYIADEKKIFLRLYVKNGKTSRIDQIKKDMAEQIAKLHADFGSKKEIQEQITGTIQ